MVKILFIIALVTGAIAVVLAWVINRIVESPKYYRKDALAQGAFLVVTTICFLAIVILLGIGVKRVGGQIVSMAKNAICASEEHVEENELTQEISQSFSAEPTTWWGRNGGWVLMTIFIVLFLITAASLWSLIM